LKKDYSTRILLAASLIGFVLSCVVHAATYAGLHIGDFPYIWVLHLSCLVIMFALVFKTANLTRGQRRRDFWVILLKPLPSWVRAASLFVLLHGAASLTWTLILDEKGQPSVINGQKVMQEHGRVLRPLNDAEYRREMALQTRLISNFLVFFFGLGCLMAWATVVRNQSRSAADLARQFSESKEHALADPRQF